MALRILPFRQYNEHNVVNLYALDGSATIPGDLATNGDGDAGLLVSINSGDFDKGIEYTSDTYLGKTDYPHIGANGYPKVTGMTFSPCDASNPLGITLRQTATHDENGEKLLYYRQKAIEHQAVLPGEVVPVLTAGLVTLAESAWVTGTVLNAAAVNETVTAGAGAEAGKLELGGAGAAIGRVLAVGSREAGDNPDQFAGTKGSPTGGYALVKIEL
jgi:hypothetical protein